MKKRKRMLFLIVPILFLASCNSEVDGVTNKEKMYLSSIQKKEVYEIQQPANFNIARGLIIKNMNNALNINAIEKGLMDLSVNHFSTEKFYMQEGQYLNEKMIAQWLRRKSIEDIGLNPAIEKSTGDILEDEKRYPLILSHVLEHNFINKENNKIEGMSIAISLNEFYDIRVSDDKGLIYTGQVKVDQNDDDINDVENYGKKVAEKIVKDIRKNEKIPNVPIYLTLFQESNINDIIPGVFLAETIIPKGGDTIAKWSQLDKKLYTFPSEALYSLDQNMYKKLLMFKEDIQAGFKHLNPKILGKLRYEDGKLTDIQIEVNAPLINDTELIGLLQLISTKLNTILFDYIPITVRIIDQQQDVGIVLWDPTEKQIFATPI
ncbi:CamS family sex pheromone protein [Lysinibacillus sp. ZYM-1]|uniref:CamS family sex pheromone protein n=1 Tax=Lysinibacillus sp. ZYM-1 TaxID=1681184 RepID=UPI0009EBBC7F|nr:CamS family sex pheromone protein [Lysinibacillus sp. ZYM-1]